MPAQICARWTSHVFDPLLWLPTDIFPKLAVGKLIGFGGFRGGMGGMNTAKSNRLVLEATNGNHMSIFAACTAVCFIAVLAIHRLIAAA